MQRFGLVNPALRADLLAAYDQVDAYGEVLETLLALKNAQAKLAILSNGTARMLSAAIQNAGLGAVFDAVFSVDTIKRFKPDQSVYALVTDGFNLKPEEISFQSSNRWDIAGATEFGFHTVWINRTSQPDEYAVLKPKMVLSSLSGLSY